MGKKEMTYVRVISFIDAVHPVSSSLLLSLSCVSWRMLPFPQILIGMVVRVKTEKMKSAKDLRRWRKICSQQTIRIQKKCRVRKVLLSVVVSHVYASRGFERQEPR